MCGLKRKPGHDNLMEGYRLVSPHPWCRLSELFLPVKRKNSSDSSSEVKLGPVHTNPDNFERGYIFLNMNRPSVHTKPVNAVTETASVLNRSPEWIFVFVSDGFGEFV